MKGHATSEMNHLLTGEDYDRDSLVQHYAPRRGEPWSKIIENFIRR